MTRLTLWISAASVALLVAACGGKDSVPEDAGAVGSAGASDVPLQSLDQVASGVGLIENLDCSGRPLRVSGHKVTGTGFLVGSRVVMTAEHGVWVGPSQRACRMRVRLSGRWYDVVAVKAWSERGESDRRGIDLATLKLSRAAPGHIFKIAPRSEAVGSAVAAVGYPLGGPLSTSRGVLTTRVLDYGKPTLAAKIVIEGGNSGGPILNSRGEVLGVVQRIVVWANLSSDGTYRHGGIDLPRWWGESARTDLCRAYPDGGILDCDPSSVGAAKRVSINLPRPD